jgi:transcriptional regulator GlxA family with amidase domain
MPILGARGEVGVVDNSRAAILEFANRCQVIVGRFELVPAADIESAVGAITRFRPAVRDRRAEALVAGIAQAAISRLRSHAECRRARGVVHAKVDATLRYLERHHARSMLRLAHAAAHVELSGSHLDRLLKQYTGTTFVHHVRGIRLRRAATLLQTTTRSVKEVAAECGYRYVSSFDRDFRRMHRCSPTEYRRHGPSDASAARDAPVPHHEGSRSL